MGFLLVWVKTLGTPGELQNAPNVPSPDLPGGRLGPRHKLCATRSEPYWHATASAPKPLAEVALTSARPRRRAWITSPLFLSFLASLGCKERDDLYRKPCFQP